MAIVIAWMGPFRIASLSAETLLEAALIAFSVLVHELAHRNVARRYGCYSKYVIDPVGLTLTLVSTVSTFKIIVPGYVLVSCADYWSVYAGNGRRALLASTAAGPFSNILLGLAFHTLSAFTTNPLLSSVLSRTASLNGWLAFFNLLPLGPLDGAKIIRGAPIVWAVMFAASLALMLLT